VKGKEIINSDQAPKAIGPYSQAVKANGFIFLSRQLPLDPVSGEFVSDGIEKQTAQCLDNIKNILKENKSGLQDIVKISVYLKDMNDFEKMNTAYAEYFSNDYPARLCIEVARLPKDARIEIEAVVRCDH
jgi:2-iminobutanoate/2-iminopropanoate deaminase